MPRCKIRRPSGKSLSPIGEWEIEDNRHERILHILDIELVVIQDILRKASVLSAEIKDMTDAIMPRLERLEFLSLRDPGLEKYVELFVEEKRPYIEELDELRKHATRIIAIGLDPANGRELVNQYHTDLEKELDEIGSILATERAILLADKTKIKLLISSYEGTIESIGMAYARSIVESLAKSARLRGSYAHYYERRPDPGVFRPADKWLFHTRLSKHYLPRDILQSRPPLTEDLTTWCPVSGLCYEGWMLAAHIIPYTVGERTAAQLLNHKESEYECIWGVSNGMMLMPFIQEALDDGAIVFAPCKDGLELIHLEQSYSIDDSSSRRVPVFGSPDRRPLIFKNDHRPGFNNLYIHALMTVLRRRQRRISGWQTDIENVFTGRSWARKEEGKEQKLLRAEILWALASEVGNLNSTELADFASRAIYPSGVVDKTTGLKITTKDLEIAVMVAGTWKSQKECEQWECLEDNWE